MHMKRPESTGRNLLTENVNGDMSRLEYWTEVLLTMNRSPRPKARSLTPPFKRPQHERSTQV